MSRDYVSGRGSRDVWTSDAALVGGGSETSGLATQIVWGVGAETFASDAALEGGGTETDCTSDALYVYIYIRMRRCVASCLFMLELNFHSGSSIYSSQWFACLASHTSRSNSPVAHPSFFPCRNPLRDNHGLRNPNKPQYNGRIIVNPGLQNGLEGWSQYGNDKVNFTEFEGNKFVIVRGRNQPYDSVSQKVCLEKGLLCTFSACNLVTSRPRERSRESRLQEEW
uniref:Uncharacterized protein n=1 Tax=Brassica oleracea var. oleracea TaxID=109376 RepID=A0A0D3C9Y9_BRAOL